jgi:hypothetical protein
MPDTEQEMFDSALSDTPVETVVETPQEKPQEPTQQATDTRQRDEKGRFAPKTEQEPPKVETPVEQPQSAQTEQPAAPEKERGEIPAWRLREEADAKREAIARAETANRELEETRRQFAAMQQQFGTLQRQLQEKASPPPDMFADPEGYQRHQAQTFQQQLRQRDVQTSEMFARLKFGDEVYDKAEKALESHIRLSPNDPIIQVLQSSAQPAFEMVRWFQQQETQKRLAGKSIDDLLKEERENALNDPAFLAKAIEKAKATATPVQPQANSNIPSLNRTTAAASDAAMTGDESDAGLYRAALHR